jgi:hypothetical protein
MPKGKPTAPKHPIGTIVTALEMERAKKLGIAIEPFTWNRKQAEMMSRREQEIGFGGAKFGGKSRGGIGFLMMGGLHELGCPSIVSHQPCDCPCCEYFKDGKPNMVYRSYLYHPKYLGCVVRKNVTDLMDWVREANEIYSHFGGEWKSGENLFRFPSGAVIYCGHYDDEATWMKYAGQNIVRFVIEEATQVTNLTKKIKLLRSCNRSIYPEMKAQMLLTFNPGGPSHGDVLERYIEAKDEDGNIIPSGTAITEEFDADEIYGRLGVKRPVGVPDKLQSTRVFIFSSIKDNPAALGNTDYLASLASLDEEEREAFLYGNWHIMSGEYFKQFRPKGPYPGEPKEANHVIPYNIGARRLRPWWWRTMAMDWGYGHECAVGWGCHDQETDQLWVEQEMVVSETEPDVVGEELARRTKPILEGLESPRIMMGLSHDAYGLRQDDRSIAEMIASGISRILGPNMVHLPDLMVDRLRDRMEQEGQSPNTKEADEIFARIRSQQRMGITIRRMRDNRIVGWQLIRSMLRWKSSLPEIKDLYDPNLASKIAWEKGLENYNAYQAIFRQKREVLPKLMMIGPPVDDKGKIVKGTGLGCQRLIDAIPKMTHDETNPEDCTRKHVEGASDLADMLRYLCLTYRGQSMPEPFKALVSRRVAETRESNPNVTTQDLVWLNRKLEADRDRGASRNPINVVRAGRSMRARVRGLIAGPVA